MHACDSLSIIVACVKSGKPLNNSPLTLSVTVTLNWYWRPSCSPDTTPEEELAGKVSVPLTRPTVV